MQVQLAALALLSIVTACGFESPAARGDGGVTDSGGPDTLVCYGTLVPVCFTALLSGPRMLADGLAIDTDATGQASLCDQHNDRRASYCVIAATQLTVAGRITARGTRPLVLLAATTLELSGEVDVASHQGPPRELGAGAAPATLEACRSVTAASEGGGGAGGSFAGPGGAGGNSNPASGGPGLAAAALDLPPVALRGGCPGGDGDTLGDPGIAGTGGPGGGAVALVAETILLDGAINASGAGGRAGPISLARGAGGGGGGGMIVLDAPTITPGLDAAVWANGGGGGQGGGGLTAPDDGGESTAPAELGARGARGTALGGFGGAGSRGLDLRGSSALDSAEAGGGGGGGGGAAGFIVARQSPGDNVSPPATLRP